MADKKAPEKTQAGVAATITACGSQSDASSVRISAGIISDNIAAGRKGADILGASRLAENVGRCVADAYDEKKIAEANKPSMWRDFTAVMGQKWDSMAGSVAGIKDDVKLVAGQAVMSGVSAVTNDTPQVIQEHQARTQQAAAMTR